MPKTRTAPNRTHREKTTPPEPAKSLREIAEGMIRQNPLKTVGQAAAVGYAMRFVPLRALLMIGTQIAAPMLCAAGLWKAVNELDRRSRRTTKKPR